MTRLEKRQNVFDLVVRALAQQGHPSSASGGRGSDCLYLSPHGRRCAVGQLIDPQVLANLPSKYNGTTVRMLPKRVLDSITDRFGLNTDASKWAELTVSQISRRRDSDLYFLSSLQTAHDDDRTWADRKGFIFRFQCVSDRYDLTFPDPDSLTFTGLLA